MATTELQAIVRFGFHDGDVELRARITGGGPVQLFTPWATM